MGKNQFSPGNVKQKRCMVKKKKEKKYSSESSACPHNSQKD